MTSIVVLVNSLEPANIIVCVRDQVDIQHVVFGGMTWLRERDTETQ